MATVKQVADAALKRILVQGAEAELEPHEYQDFIFALNNYMLSLDAKGITLGYTRVDNLGDDVTVPSGALRGIIANMAIEVSPDYGGKVSDGLVKAAEEGMHSMMMIGQSITQTEFPSTLPYGSGQYDSYSGIDFASQYYPDLEAEILAETTGAIGLETGTDE